MSDPAASPAARAMGAVPLPPPPAHSAALLAMMEALLDQRPIPAGVEAGYLAPAAIAARAEAAAEQQRADWPALARYRAANAALNRRPELVMIGDSLTEIWQIAIPDAFGDRTVNRGIAGQTSGQILLRFMADVVDLAPRRVHILCGTNDVAGNTGPSVPEDYRRNIRAMVDLASANGIAVVLATIPPAHAIPWNPAADPRRWIPQLNGWLRAYAAGRDVRLVDYHALLTDGAGALQPRYSADGVHVTRAAYHAMHACLIGSVA